MSPLSSADKDGELSWPSSSPPSVVLHVSMVTMCLPGDAFQSSSEFDLDVAEEGENVNI